MNSQRLNILEEFKSVQGKGETFNFITMLMESLLMSQGLNIKTIVMDGNLYFTHLSFTRNVDDIFNIFTNEYTILLNLL